MYRSAGSLLLLVAVTVAIAVGAAACGGSDSGGTGDGGQEQRTQPVSGRGFRFSAPAGWAVSRRETSVTARPGAASDEYVAVTRYRLLSPFRVDLWPGVVRELDGQLARLARALDGQLVERRTLTVAQSRARSYQIVFSKSGREFVQRNTFVFRGRQEYQLACRFEGSGPAADACGLLVRSFSLA